MPIDKKTEKGDEKKNILFSVVTSLDFRVTEEGTSLGMFARMSFISANGIILLHYFYCFFDKYFFFLLLHNIFNFRSIFVVEAARHFKT